MATLDATPPPLKDNVLLAPKLLDGSAPFKVHITDDKTVTLPPRADPLAVTKNRDLSSTHTAILGLSTGAGTSAAAAMEGPDALRAANLVEHLKQLGFGSCLDIGDVRERPVEQKECESRTDHLMRQIGAFAREGVGRILPLLNSGKLVICLGGDHSMSFASIKAFAAFCHEKQLTGGVIHIDAHGDVNGLKEENNFQPQPGESGNPHGMVMRSGFATLHPEIDGIAPPEATLKWENFLSIGLRALDVEEQETFRNGPAKGFTKSDVAIRIAEVLERIRNLRERVDVIMISFDLDACDKSISPATEMQNDDGLNLEQLLQIADAIAVEGAGLAPTVAIDVAEYYPPNEDTNFTTIKTIKQFLERAVGITDSSYMQHMIRETEGQKVDGNELLPLVMPESQVTCDALIDRVLANRIFREWDKDQNSKAVKEETPSKRLSSLSKIGISVAATFLGVGVFFQSVGLRFSKETDSEVNNTPAQVGMAEPALRVADVASAPVFPVKWGYEPAYRDNLKDPLGVGFSDVIMTSEWDITHQLRAPDPFEHTKELAVRTLKWNEEDFIKIAPREKSDFYHPGLGMANSSDHYHRNSTISAMCTALSVALLRTPQESRRKLLDAVVTDLFSDEAVRKQFLQEFEKFSFSLKNPDEVMRMLRRSRKIPESN
jgi:arginase